MGRMNPSFSPELEEEGAVNEELAPVVMGPPAYASPDPRTNSGVLVSIEEHPLSADLSPDYGQDVIDMGVHHVATPLGVEDEDNAFSGLPDDREDWTNADWQKVAKHYGLPVGGGKAKLKERVEAHEEEIDAAGSMTAAEWIDLVGGTENAEDLASLRTRYEESGADFKTVDEAFEKQAVAFEDQ